ncbi:hypothetical protein [Prosthecobacter fusiformis]|uniref:hypothetical protein n=1 Tax=Prosthecobacter fusiformis TaxID=48464 RepID=UPI0010621ED8|nr:hypothetical protein [Prosthecobacter fusiformis]
MNYDIVSASKLANAVKHFGDVESLSINHGDERTIIFLAEIGRLNSLTKLLIFDAPVNDKILQGFTFPKLQKLSLVNCDITGVHWPLLPELQEVDLGGCPISDEGFKAILKSPKINYLIFENASITPNGLLMSGAALHPNLIRLQFSNCAWPRVSIEEAEARIRKLNSRLQLSW